MTPWGGTNPAKWRPEAVLANAVSAFLNDAWGQANVDDVVVAVPLKMYASEFYPYGDGQSNAIPSFESWQQARPPVLAALLRQSGVAAKVLFRFDRALPVTGAAFDVLVPSGGTTKTVSVTATRTAAGDWQAEWAPARELGWDTSTSAGAIMVRPHGWKDGFPIWFRLPIRSIDEMKASVPTSMQHFADGGGIVDHEGVAAAGAPAAKLLRTLLFHSLHDAHGTTAPLDFVTAQGADAGTPFQRLSKHHFSPAYNQDPFQPDNIHGRFPYQGKQLVTGVGRGWTWVADKPAAPFKTLYSAFERRRPENEASAPDGGVASGGGWHRIGDPAETILNSLETGPLVIGSATNKPMAKPLADGYAYNLSDVATIRWLWPGEAFVTRRGRPGQDNYHWFLFQQNTEVTTEEWVHPCVPSDRFDFGCGG